MTVTIKLSSSELMSAAVTGALRRITSLQNKLNAGIYHASGNEWSTDIDGAAAEMALAKHIGAYWSAHVNSMKEADVLNWQVRSTHHKDGCLIIRGHDDPEQSYVLVTSAAPNYTIVGWMSAKEGRQDRNFRRSNTGLDAWWVPQQDLHPV